MKRDQSLESQNAAESRQTRLLQRFRDAQQLYSQGLVQSSEYSEENSSTKTEEVERPLFYDGLYAPSGFDIMSILLRVMSRPHPTIDIGAVDTNAAIILCDTLAHDTPIVYCSEGFETLTGYQSTEVIGQNCRFLQSPHPLLSGNEKTLPEAEESATVASKKPTGRSKRRLTMGPPPAEAAAAGGDFPRDDREMLSQFKSLLNSGMEAQVTLTNYKKGGMRFTNLLTAIPISWSSDIDDRRYIVGFQADRQDCVFAPP